MKQIPIMFLSDAPDQSSGLARITRDLATMMCSHPRFRVATLGWHGSGSVRLPWQQYQMGSAEFGESSLPYAWSDFSRGEKGIIFTVWDLSRLLWLARPEFLADEGLKQRVIDLRQQALIWSYFPIDSTGPNDRLTAMSRETLLGINRVLVTSPWAEGVIRRTIGDEEAAARGLTWIPHPNNADVFNPGTQGGVLLSDAQNERVTIGVVATNQVRKNWALTGEVCALLRKKYPHLRLWFHVDVDLRHWSLPAILEDFRLADITEVTHPPIEDKELARRYRACSVTLHPGEGEGHCYPIWESLACGVPVIHGDYASGADLMRTCGLDHLTVTPVAYRYETEHNCKRPVFRAEDWADKVTEVLDHRGPWELPAKVEHLSVKSLYWVWKRWFEEGMV